MRKRNAVKTLILNLIAVFVSAIMLVPLLLVVINAFKTKREAASLNFNLPAEWHFENFDRGQQPRPGLHKPALRSFEGPGPEV